VDVIESGAAAIVHTLLGGRWWDFLRRLWAACSRVLRVARRASRNIWPAICVFSRMGLVLLLVLVLVLGWLMFAVVGSLIGLVLTLFVAGLIGWLADMVVPGELPGGWIGAVLAGIIGGFIGGLVFHALRLPGTGLRLFEIELIPAFVGAVVVAVAAELFTSRSRRLA